MLVQCIKIELEKSIRNKGCLIALVFGAALSLNHAVKTIAAFNQFKEALQMGEISGNPMITIISTFTQWLGANVSSFESNTFFFLLPLMVVLPYGWSLAGELKSGYVQNILSKVRRIDYFVSKYIAVFISAAIVIIIPLLLNFLILSLFLPALKMDNIYPYGSVGQVSMWSGIFYQKPMLYTFMYILFDGFFAGLIASISTMSALFIKNKLPVMMIPFFSMILLDYIDTNLIVYHEFSPIKFLRLLPIANDRNGFVILFEIVVLILITLGIILYKEGKYETI